VIACVCVRVLVGGGDVGGAAVVVVADVAVAVAVGVDVAVAVDVVVVGGGVCVVWLLLLLFAWWATYCGVATSSSLARPRWASQTAPQKSPPAPAIGFQDHQRPRAEPKEQYNCLSRFRVAAHAQT